MGPDVAIEVSAADTASPHVSALVQACTQALARGRCAVAAPSDPADPAQATAIVGWDGPGHGRVRIEVGVRRDGKPRWISREITFRPEDAESERWRAAGLVVATLAGAARSGEEPEVPAPRVEQPAASPPPDRPLSRRGRLQAPIGRIRDAVVLELAAAAGPALEDGTWRIGPGARAGYAFGRIPVAAWAGLRWGVRPADATGLSATWTGLSAGVGPWISLAGGQAVVAGRLEILGELVSASVGDAVGPTAPGAREGEVWIAGARAGVDASWMLAPPLGLVAGGDVGLLRSGTVLEVRGADVTRASRVSATVTLGVRVMLPTP